MPKIDDGQIDGPPGNELRTAAVELTTDEAYHLLASLTDWAERIAEGRPDPGWHMHIDDSRSQLVISVKLDAASK